MYRKSDKHDSIRRKRIQERSKDIINFYNRRKGKARKEKEKEEDREIKEMWRRSG